MEAPRRRAAQGQVRTHRYGGISSRRCAAAWSRLRAACRAGAGSRRPVREQVRLQSNSAPRWGEENEEQNVDLRFRFRRRGMTGAGSPSSSAAFAASA